MHLTLKKEATRPAGANILQQQGKFDTFTEEFNRERPHEALEMNCPAEVYSPSCGPYRGIPEATLPVPRPDASGHQLRPDLPAPQENQSQQIAGWSGRRCQGGRDRHLAGQLYGLRSRLYRSEERTLQPLENPFGPQAALAGAESNSMKSPGQTEASHAPKELHFWGW
jgi:hypothetical protein